MHKYTEITDAVRVLEVHLDVEHRFGRGARVDALDNCRAVYRVQAFTGGERIGSHEVLPVFAPDRVVTGGTDRFVFSGDVDLDDAGRRVGECTSDQLKGAGWTRSEWRTGLDGMNLC